MGPCRISGYSGCDGSPTSFVTVLSLTDVGAKALPNYDRRPNFPLGSLSGEMVLVIFGQIVGYLCLGNGTPVEFLGILDVMDPQHRL